MGQQQRQQQQQQQHNNNVDVTALSCAFRAGRENASTDHDSILFDVDPKRGEILGGSTNAHWYRLGLNAIASCPWRSPFHTYTCHPDVKDTIQKKSLKGKFVQPHISELMDLAERAHKELCPRVPLAGWDIVLCKDFKKNTTNNDGGNGNGICLLEVNLSCNFFCGSFDTKVYLDFMEDAFTTLQTKRLVQENNNRNQENPKSSNMSQKTL